LVSARKLLDALGPPDDAGVSELYYEWSLALLPRYPGAEGEGEGDSLASRLRGGAAGAEADIDPACKLSVMGFGADAENITSFCGLCLLRALSDQPDKLKELLPLEEMGDEDVPVFWYLRHHAAHTHAVLQFLEARLPGLRFLCSSADGAGGDGPLDEALLDEDDLELHEMLGSFYRHPSNAEAAAAGLSGGSGTLVGIDLHALLRYALLTSDADTPIDISVPPDLTRFVKPLGARLGLCFGEDSAPFVRMYYAHVLNDGSASKLRSPVARRAGDDLSALNAFFHAQRVKLVDLGNACWTDRHFTDDIQTRQYRSPETILGSRYDTSADMWSLACIVFELLTGDLLFDPQTGKHWDRDEDHLAMIAELMGDFPRKVSGQGKRSAQYFTKKGDFRHIHNLKYWPLRVVFRDKYLFSEEDAAAAAQFLEPLLAVCVLDYCLILSYLLCF
jgi:hypothetical protein